MTRSVGLSLVAVAVVGAGFAFGPEVRVDTAANAPFWQLQGTAPAAGDPAALVEMRQAARLDARTITVAMQAVH